MHSRIPKSPQSAAKGPQAHPARAAAGTPDQLRALQSSHGNHRVQRILDGRTARSGQPLDASVRAQAERGFGGGLGDVRVHTDPAAAASAHALHARAYTTGPDIFFAAGRYAPHSSGGRNLLLHELAHVVQQSRGTSTGAVGRAGDVHERAASSAARTVGAGGMAAIAPGATVPAVQCDEETTAAPTEAPATPTRLTPPSMPEETDEERINRMLAEDAAKGNTGGATAGGISSIIPGSEDSLAAAVRRLLARCEADSRGEAERKPTRPEAGAGEPRLGGEQPMEEITRRIEACLDTPDGQKLVEQAKAILLSRRNAPITIAAYLATIVARGRGSIPLKTIQLHDDLDLSIGVEGAVSKEEQKVLVTFKFRGSWLERAASATWGGITTAGRAIGSAGAAVGRAVGTAGAAVGRAVGTAGAAVGRAVGTAGAAVGRSLWSGLKAVGRGFASVGRAIWTGLKAAGSAIATAAGAVWTGLKWVAGQLWDKVTGIFQRIGHWIERLPARVGRLLLGLWEGVKSLKPWSLEWWKSLGDASTWTGLLKWLGTRVIDLLEIIGLGEAYETAMDFLKFTTRPLTDSEIQKASTIFGSSIDYRLVRLDQHAVLGPTWTGRDYTSFHTINSWGKSTDDVLVHELTHVWQYEHAGAIYMPQAVHAQAWGKGYDYNGAAGLRAAQAAGKGFDSFNREQQAQIVQDFYKMTQSDPDIALYASFVKAVSTLPEALLISKRPP
jgi:hypothetical protein